MKEIGMALWIAGLCLFGYASFLFDPSISGGYDSTRIVNVDLQQRQLLLGMAGLAFFLAGVVVHSLAALFLPQVTSATGVVTRTDGNSTLPPGVTQQEWDEQLAAARAFNEQMGSK